MPSNFSKLSILGVSLCACLSTYAYAYNNNSGDQFLNPSSSYTPNQQSANGSLPTPAEFQSNNGFFIAAGASYSYMKLPDFTYASQLDANFFPTSSPAFRFKNHISTVMPSLEIGKYFYNNRFMPFIFGQRIGIVLKGSYWSDKNSSSMNTADNAYFWPIDGSSNKDIFATFDQLQNVQFTAKNRYWHGAALITGHAVMGNSGIAQFSRDVRIGFVYYNLHQDFNFSAQRVANVDNNPDPQFDRPQTLSETTDTNYIGGQIGTTLNAQFNPNVTAFIKGDLALVSAKTTFDGYQLSSPLAQPVKFPGFTATVNETNNKFTYIADVGAGMTFRATNFPVSLTLAGGVQFFGYVPRIENPSTVGPVPGKVSGPATIVGTSAVNPYGMIKVTLPF